MIYACLEGLCMQIDLSFLNPKGDVKHVPFKLGILAIGVQSDWDE